LDSPAARFTPHSITPAYATAPRAHIFASPSASAYTPALISQLLTLLSATS